MNKKHPLSLRMRLLLTILLCWVLPILIIMSLAGVLVRSNYEQSMRQELRTYAENALEQLEIRLDAVFDASKSVSYDGAVRNAYRLYELNGDSGALYRKVNEYLKENFTRDDRIPATFISFWEVPEIRPVAANRSDFGYHTQKEYRDLVEQDILEKMKDQDTRILLEEYDGRLYLARNLLSSQLQPYATVVLQCDEKQLFQSLDAIRSIAGVRLVMDGHLALDEEGIFRTVGEEEPSGEPTLSCTSEVDGHTLRLDATIQPFDFWTDTPHLREASLWVMLLVLPLLGIAIWLFHRLVAQPVNVLSEAEARLQSGDRGYQIEESGRSREFQALFDHFNKMSTELSNQFDRSYREQQALQKAKIKALQFQINPHFLNNTLEIINWEARIDGNERVSAMIEALSVMLDAALDRDERSQILLSEELSYVDAYLYIIKERLGDHLQVERNIDEELMDTPIPRLIFQPIVENAVEHDIVPHKGGRLVLRAHREGHSLVLEVEHDGILTDSDREYIDNLIKGESTDAGGKVGLRNVAERLRLLYGDKGALHIEQNSPTTILASIRFPAENGL